MARLPAYVENLLFPFLHLKRWDRTMGSVEPQYSFPSTYLLDLATIQQSTSISD